jgi:hypothetical protein
MNQTALLVTTAIVGVVVGVLGTVIIVNTTTPTAATDYPTFRPTIKSKTKQVLEDCNPFPFTAAKHPTHMYQIKLPGTPFDIRDLKPQITEMDVTTAPWTDGDPSTSKGYNGNVTWTPSTPLDMDLNLGPATPATAPTSATTAETYNQVLIKIVIDDPAVTMIGNDFTIISTDANRKMFCKFAGGFKTNSATFMASYVKPVPNQKTFGSYSLGVNIPSTDKTYVLPIYIDPEVENNGVN